MPPALTHREAVLKVCAVCTNLHGEKAVRPVSETEELLIQQHVFSSYKRNYDWFPNGLCKRCIADLKALSKNKLKRDLLLPANYSCELPRVLRSAPAGPCQCRWCQLARLSGPAFLLWKASLKKKEQPRISYLCTKCGRGFPAGQVSHVCAASDLEIVRGMTAALPAELKGKLALSLLREVAADQGAGEGDQILLPQVHGGLPTPVKLSSSSCLTTIPQLNATEVQAMASSAHLTAGQTRSVLSDLGSKFGRKAIEPEVKTALVDLNRRFSPYFTLEETNFMDKNGDIVSRPFFYCNKTLEFLHLVAELRGEDWNQLRLLVQGDSGQGWFKVAISMIRQEDLEVQKSGQKRRRSRDDGIGGGPGFKSYGTRKILILALVQGIPETNFNLDIVFQAIGLRFLTYKITGDLHFCMPSFGLMPCSSSNPCLFCPRSRTKKGGVFKWEDGDIQNRTLGSLHQNYAGWHMEGEVEKTAQTRKWKSVTNPVLVEGVGDTWETSVLEKSVPGSLHLLLAANDLLLHLEATCWPDLKTCLFQLYGIKPHNYQGKDRNFQGPQIRKLFRGVDKLMPLMTEDPRKLYLDALVQMAKVNSGVFGLELHLEWRERLHSLKDSLFLLHSRTGLPITPKFHILVVHVEEWVDNFGRALGMESEQPGESLHHLWRVVLEQVGEPKDKDSKIWRDIILRCLLKVNSDNV